MKRVQFPQDFFFAHKQGRRSIVLYTNTASVTSCENDLLLLLTFSLPSPWWNLKVDPNVLVMQTCFIILQVQVFQSFFVSLNLPYSVIRGEELALQVTVFNYEPKAQQVTVTLKGSKHWAIIDEVNKLGLRGENPVNKDYVEKEMDLKVVVSVGAGQGRAISFPVVLRTLGLVPVEVRAQSTSHADAVKRNLLVEVGEQCVYADYNLY